MATNTQVQAVHNAPPITRMLAEFVTNHPSRGWSDAVEAQAVKTFSNWLGCAIGAADHEAVKAALATAQEFEPAAQATVLGRKERLDIANAALVNGIASHTFDFDDTHLKTIIHPAGPVASALLALAEKTGASGRELLDALVLGIDVACRLGNMIYPQHYDRGWHITGSTGTLGAAAACARLLKLSVDQTQMALAIAASQPIGLREQFGTMTKPFHPGGAARAGLTSALLAKHGFTGSTRAIEAPRGFAQVVSTKFDWAEVTEELGERFEISFNTYKPFACGIVIHPSIDACAQLRDVHGVKPEDIERIDIRVHSLVLELTGKKTPKNGLEGKFSVYHGCACGLMFGKAGEPEFSDAVVTRPDMIALRARVHAQVDNLIDEAAVDLVATLKDGRAIAVKVEHAIGSLERPMNQTQLDAKFDDLVAPVLGKEQSHALRNACLHLGEADSLHALLRLTVPC